MATDILNSYIQTFIVYLLRENDDVITVSTRYLSPNNDTYELDKRTISPVMIQTTQSIQELRPEISTVYPFRAPVELDYDNSAILLSPSVSAIPTASQDYYVPIYFERYKTDVVSLLDKDFVELTV
jgi:hypothetical protein